MTKKCLTGPSLAALIFFTSGITSILRAQAANQIPEWSQRPGLLLFTNSANLRGGDRPSDFDWMTVTTNMTTNIIQPNWAIADDFLADGRPITTVRWWGSYLNGATNGFEDGFVLSFLDGCAACLVGGPGMGALPEPLLATYAVPRLAVRSFNTGFLGWYSNTIYQYEVELKDTALVRAFTNLATPTAFLTGSNAHYFLSIEAEAGERWVAQTNESGVITNWLAQASSNRATNHFWGWHTSPITNCLAPSSGLVSWWPADVNGQDIIGANQALLQNGASFVPGIVGQAFNFDGVDDYANTGDFDDVYDPRTGSFTVDCWYRQTATSTDSSILRKGLTSQSTPQEAGYGLTCGSGLLSFIVAVGPTTASRYIVTASTNLPTLNAWHHVAGVLDRTAQRVRLYLNGRLVAETSFDSRLTDIYNDRPLVIGAMSRSGEFLSFFSGQIDEVQYFNRALSSNEISAIFNAGSGGQCKPGGPLNDCLAAPAALAAWWPGDGNTQDIFGNNPASAVNSITYATGKVGQAFQFNGASTFLRMGDILDPGAASFTVDGWFKQTSATAEARIISKGLTGSSQPPDIGFGITVSATLIQFVVGDGARGIYATAALPSLNAFHHVAGVLDRSIGVMELYLDGARVSRQPLGNFGNVDTEIYLALGAADRGPRDSVVGFFPGQIDEVHYFRRALTSNELTAIYSAGSAGLCKPGGNLTIGGSSPSYMGHLAIQGTNWVYPFNLWQPNNPFHMELDQAFELLTPCISLYCPGNFTIWTCTNSARLNFTIGVSNACANSAFINCNPTNGSILPTGVTNVLCRAFDFQGHSNNCSFTVTVVQDTGPPTISCSNIVVSTPASGIAVEYALNVSDDCDTNLTLTCTPPSGAFFRIGTAPVTCAATDHCGHTAQCNFTVIVIGPPGNKDSKWSQLPDYLASTNRNMLGGDRPSDFDWDTLMRGGPVLDQVYLYTSPPDDREFSIDTSIERAQTFTVGTGGTLSRIDLYLRRDGDPSGDLLFDIRSTTAGGAPVEANLPVLASRTLTGGSFLGGYSFYSIDLSTFGITVTPGQVLAIVLRATNPNANYRWAGSAFNPYARGALYNRGPIVGPTWTLNGGGALDASFRTFVDTNRLAPNWIIADDFRSDGRPIQCVRWWGSYIPNSNGLFEVGFEDGFVLSFFSDVPVSGANTFSQPGQLLGAYIAPPSAVRRFNTGYIGWDGNYIFQYEAALRDACLDHAATNVATPTAFLEVSNTVYWLSITAEVGRDLSPIRNSEGAVVAWNQEETDRHASQHFWGWHTSPTNWNDSSVMGHLRMTNVDWLYSQWMANDLYHMERDQAFELLTTCITLLCPTNFAVWTCGNSVTTNYESLVRATDTCDANVNITCNPPSSAPLPLGTNLVICTGRDSRGYIEKCSFAITVVQDTSPPILLCPTNITAFACNQPASVSYNVRTTDDCDPNVTVICSPPGGLFPLGVTSVFCNAFDDCGNAANCTFTVTVTNYPAIKWSQPPGFLVFTNNPNLRGTNRPSDFDWRTLMETPGQAPDWVIADDFISDGRPILCVRWWGSYMPGYGPGFEDGFVLSFFSDVPAAANSFDTNFSRPGVLLGSYVGSPQFARNSGFVSCDGEPIYEYTLDLRDTCLEHAVSGLAIPGAFLEAQSNIYWLAITAEIGRRFDPARNEFGVITNWTQSDTGKPRATEHFWGWHTSPTNWNDGSVMGLVLMSGTNWDYPAASWRSNQFACAELDQAFQLMTTNGFTNIVLSTTNKVSKWSQPPGFVYDPSGTNRYGADRGSDFDWIAMMGGRPALYPPWIIADDFRSDGRPILCVRWWGSYLNGVTNRLEDGFVLSFFTDVPANVNPTGPFSEPGNLLATYVVPISAVTATNTGYLGCDSNYIWEYTASLAETCLEHSNTPIATASAFLEVSNTVYWLSISAESGCIYTNPGAYWTNFPSFRPPPTDHFWGWHTSPTNNLDMSSMGFVAMFAMNWVYGNWRPNGPFWGEVDQAFELLTTNAPPLARPILGRPAIVGPNVVITFTTVSGAAYVIESARTLPAANGQVSWQAASGLIAGTGDPVVFTDPGAAVGPSIFYRVAASPPSLRRVDCGISKLVFTNTFFRSQEICVLVTDKCQGEDSSVYVLDRDGNPVENQKVPDGETKEVKVTVPPGGQIYLSCIGQHLEGYCDCTIQAHCEK